MSSDWFYHAPQKRKDQREAPLMPPMSQVPGLSDLLAEEVEKVNRPQGVLIRDTDSKYIRLAKMGGRKNLLYFKTVSEAPTEPKKYPIPEWWGYRGVADETELANEKRLKPSIPDYMVHESYIAASEQERAGEQGRSRARIPFGQDGQSQWSREAQNLKATPSNVVIRKRRQFLEPIDSRPLRNLSAEKPAGMSLKSRSQSAKDRSPSHAFVPELPLRMKTYIASNESEAPILSKILNYGYQRDWLGEREKQRKVDEEKRRIYSHNVRNALEEARSQNTFQHEPSNVHVTSQPVFASRGAELTQPSSKGRKQVDLASKAGSEKAKPWRTTCKTAHHAAPPDPSTLYKMKKFQNVPSKFHPEASQVQQAY